MDYTDRTCIIVVNIGRLSVGLIVDQVAEVLPIPDDKIVAPPGSKSGFHNRFIKGIGKVGEEAKLLLDCGLLLDEKELQEIETINQGKYVFAEVMENEKI